MDKTGIERVKTDLEFLFNKVLGIVVYGSIAKGEENERSDIDVCIIAPNEDSSKIFKETLPLNYDIKIFELMPLYLKMEVIENHKIIYTKNICELYEYFYFFRKLWNDQKHRQKLSKEEILYIFG